MASIHRRPGSRFWHAAFRDSIGRLQLRSTKLSDRRKALITALEFERASQLATEGMLVETQARKFVNELMERVGEPSQLRSPSIEQTLRDWLTVRVQAKATGTQPRYHKVVADLIAFLKARAKKPLVTLTPNDIQGFLNHRLTHDGCSPTTVNTDGKVLRTALNYTRRQGLITLNPAEAVELPRCDSVERSVFTTAEVYQLIEAAEGEWKTLIMVAYFTGLRLSDCCRLGWSDIDLQNQTLTIKVKKTKKPLLVPIHPELLAHLTKLRASDPVGAFVMPGISMKGSGGKHGMSEGFKRIVRRAGLDLQTVQGSGLRKISRRTFHALRHSFTSALANAGVSPEIRMKLTGHTTEASHKVYTHHEMQTLRSALTSIPAMNHKQANPA